MKWKASLYHFGQKTSVRESPASTGNVGLPMPETGSETPLTSTSIPREMPHDTTTTFKPRSPPSCSQETAVSQTNQSSLDNYFRRPTTPSRSKCAGDSPTYRFPDDAPRQSTRPTIRGRPNNRLIRSRSVSGRRKRTPSGDEEEVRLGSKLRRSDMEVPALDYFDNPCRD